MARKKLSSKNKKSNTDSNNKKIEKTKKLSEKKIAKKRKLEAFKAKKANPLIRKVDNLISALNPKHYFPNGIGRKIDFDSPKIKKTIKVMGVIGVVSFFLGLILIFGLIVTGRLFVSNSKLVVRLPVKIPFLNSTE